MNGLNDSLGTMHVNSTHYYGPDNPGVPGDLITSIGKYASVEMYPAKPFTFKNHSGMQTFREMMDHADNTPYRVGDMNVHKTVNRVFTAPEIDGVMGSNYNGEFLYNPGKPSDRMAGWLGEDRHAVEYVRTPEFQVFMVSSHDRPATHESAKYVTEAEMDGPINRVGEMYSRAETLKQAAKKHNLSKDGQELELRYSGGNEAIEYLGVTSGSRRLYSIGRRVKDGKIALFTGVNVYDQMSKEADAFGLSLEDFINATIAEEAMHHYRRSYDRDISELEARIAEERATKEALLDFYMDLRDNSESNPQIREGYAKIVRRIVHDIRTIGRYRILYEARKSEGARKNDAEQSALEKLIEDPESSGLREAIDSLGEVPSDYDASSEYAEAGQTEVGEAEASEAEGAEAAAE